MQYAIEISSNCNCQVPQGSAKTHVKSGGEFLCHVCTKFLKNLSVTEFCKSVYIGRSYDQKSNVLFFRLTMYLN